MKQEQQGQQLSQEEMKDINGGSRNGGLLGNLPIIGDLLGGNDGSYGDDENNDNGGSQSGGHSSSNGGGLLGGLL